MITIKRGKKHIKDIETKRWIIRHKENIKKAFSNYGKEITDELKRIIITGRRSGRVYIIKGVQHQASREGEPPANLTGKLADGFMYKAGMFRLSIYSKVKSNRGFNYPAYLEEDLNRPYFEITNKRNAYKLEKELYLHDL